jgi:flagellar hook-associated protein 2
MGAVGLNFGSPTSGAGFDVSSTVATIVGNLQNVETPWKSQLTKLESQDTTISSLGTLFSNLSNDMSSLTDLEGIMAQKEGSSSDQNVLTLTAATSAAVAGTHSVEVTSLAQTSSGYLAPVSSASAPLTGSITLHVGAGGAAKTITLNSSDNTLSGLASAVNSSGVGVTASVLTDSSGSRLSLVSGTSGAKGNISIDANSISAYLNYTASGSSTYSTGTLDSIVNSGDVLSGSLSIQLGNGTAENIVIGAAPSSPPAHTIYTGSGVNTLASIANFITHAGIGVGASVVTNSDGSSSLQLVSGTAGTAGTLTVNSTLLDTITSKLGYSNPVVGADAQLSVDGVALTSSSNTVANLIPGVTFQLLAPSAKESDNSLEQVQVVIANDNSGVESAFNSMVSDYNSLISAVNAQEGLDSSGNAEPLFGSPTLSLLQQQLLGGLNTQNPSGNLDSIATNTNTTLAGSISIAVGNGQTQTFNIGSGVNDPATNTYYTGSGSGYNTLSSLADAINAAAAGSQLTYSGVDGSDTVTSSGVMVANSAAVLSGSVSIQVAGGPAETIVFGDAPTAGPAANTFYTGSTGSDTTLAGLAAAINGVTGNPVSAGIATTDGVTTLTLTSGTPGTAGTLTVTPNILATGTGVTANVVTLNGESSLALLSQTAGSGGALTVDSSIAATSDAPLSFQSAAGSSTQTASGALTAVANANDVLTGSVSIQVGSGKAQTVNLPSSGGTLTDLKNAINLANVGVTASIGTSSSGLPILSLLSGTAGSAGTLTLTSSILDTTNTSTATLNYTNSSDVSSIGNLGIGVNNDGTITLDATSLDSTLNADYSGVMGFFQNANSWGQTFSNILTNAGTSSPTAILALASTSNSNIESTLNADISKEQSLISAQQTSLTAELNSANEIMQQLPSELQGVNELYSAITGYDQNLNG